MRPGYLFLFLLCLSVCVGAAERLPLFDVHTHYKWTQEEVTTPQQAVDALIEQKVERAVVIGTPPEYALKMKAIDPERVIAIYGPYNGRRNWHSWARDQQLVTEASTALSSGGYQGIGELHLIGGFAPQRDKPGVVDQLLKLGVEYDVPVMIHTEFSSPIPLLRLCGRHPKSKIIWAHSGSILKTTQVDQVLSVCPNVYPELAARDPWRFVSAPTFDKETGHLLPEWQALVIKYQDRFMIGSDTVWPVDQLDSWDTPDSGWQELGRFLDFHRGWLEGLPEPVRTKVSIDNASRLFNVQN